MSNPLAGANYLLRGLRMLMQPGVRAFVVIPLFINISLFVALLVFGANQFEALLQGIMPSLPDWLQWLSWILWLVFGLLALLIVFFSFSLLCNLVAAPFNSLLAVAVERNLGGSIPEEKTSLASFISGFIPSIVNEAKKLGFILAWSIPFLILFLIPVVNLAAPVLWFLYSAWMLAIEYLDYPGSNHAISFKALRQGLREQRLRSFGFGSTVSVATMIPVANFLVMPAAVAGATIYWHERLHGTIRASSTSN